jgi:hypothetical protein
MTILLSRESLGPAYGEAMLRLYCERIAFRTKGQCTLILKHDSDAASTVLRLTVSIVLKLALPHECLSSIYFVMV